MQIEGYKEVSASQLQQVVLESVDRRMCACVLVEDSEVWCSNFLGNEMKCALQGHVPWQLSLSAYGESFC